ncbi:MAG: hypothetical protein K0Q68_3 [Moraxellaceae bacterium]|jgi:hypothetical protein|nr:hypothetical protein [Moraxellaceae bacterium]
MIAATRPAQSAPPLAFALFWNAFTAVHAYFMLRGFWGSWAMLFLVPFYALFFGVGFWMLRQWWGMRSLRRQFGAPALATLPPVVPGQSLQVAVEFDRAWERAAVLAGSYAWVEVMSKGGSGRTLAESPLQGGPAAGARGTTWQAQGLVPPRPEGTQAMRLEMLLQEQGGAPGSGWRFALPVSVADAAGAAPRQMTPAQVRQIERVLGWIMIPLLGVGTWQLYAHVQSGARTLFPLVFPGAFLLAAWVLHDLRGALTGLSGAGSMDPAQVKERLTPFVKGIRLRIQVFFTLAVAAFFADMFGLLKLL